MRAAIDQRLVNPEFPRLGRTPGKHAFPANPVAKLHFALDDQDARPRLREGDPEARTCEPAADDGEIVIHRTLLRLCSPPEGSNDLARSLDADRRGEDREIDTGGAERRELSPAA